MFKKNWTAILVFILLVIAVVISLPACTVPKKDMITSASSVGCDIAKWSKRGNSETIICYKPIELVNDYE